jgi:hypothetical protein
MGVAGNYAIVFVSNDVVYNQTLAFLESVTRNSPGIPLVCIPYDQELALIKKLARVYGFTFFDDFDISAFQNISTIMIGRPLARLRKLAAFMVPVDEFLSLDTDIIVLRDLKPLFGHIGEDCDVLHTDHPLIAHSKQINTGAFVSSRRIFDYQHHVATIMAHYPTFKRLAVMENDDQPFGSFVFDIDRRKYESIETICEYAEDLWYKNPYIEWRNGVLVHVGKNRLVPMIHYAGVTRAEGYESAERFSDVAMHYFDLGRQRMAAAALLEA